MARVVVRPAGVEFEVDPDETVFVAAERCGIRWPTICGGVGSCSTCFAVITEGECHAGPIESLELESLSRLDVDSAGADGVLRLACQLTLTGDVVLKRSGVRKPKPKP